METAAGSTSLVGSRLAEEGELVRRLRQSGAVILGKTNMSQWGMLRTMVGGSGWTSRGGLRVCKDMKASGNSSGSAVATALGLATACIAGESDGSIISPSSKNSVVSFKPTVELIASDGLIPAAIKQNCPGPITRTVADAALMLDVLSNETSGTGAAPYSESFTGTDLKGLRIGVPTSTLSEGGDAPKAAFREALSPLSEAGATIVHDISYAGLERFTQLTRNEQMQVMAGNFKQDIKDYLASLEDNPLNFRDLGDLTSTSKGNRAKSTYPSRGIELFELAYNTDLNPPSYKSAVKADAYSAGEGGIPSALERDSLDLLVAPAMIGPSVSFAARAGLPGVVAPLGQYPDGTDVKYPKSGPDTLVDKAPNIPFGLLFIGAARSEWILLRAAYAFEQLTDVSSQLVCYNPPREDLRDVDVRDHTLPSKV